MVDGNPVLNAVFPNQPKAGFVGFGTGGFYSGEFDDFFILDGGLSL